MKESRDILTLFEQLNSHEVFTPPRVARDMLALLPKDIWCDPSIRILDPCVKSGVFLREALYLLIDGLAGKGKHIGYDGIEYDLNDGQQRMNHILKNMLFGIATSELTGYISRRTLYGVMEANTDKQTALIDALEKSKSHKIWTEEEKVRFLVRNHFNEYYDHGLFNVPDYAGFEHEGNIFYPAAEVNKKVDDSNAFIFEDTYYPFIEEQVNHRIIQQIKGGQMKFDIIIGNPPYQVNVGNESGNRAKAKAIYHRFVEGAINLNPRHASFIIPSRWMTKSADGVPEAWIDGMVYGNKLEKVVDYHDSKECFPGVDVMGGVMYFLWSKNHNGKCHVVSHKNGCVLEEVNELDPLKCGVVIRDIRSKMIIEKISDVHGEYYNRESENFSHMVSPKDFFTNKTSLTSSWKDYSDKPLTDDCVKYYVNETIHKKKFGWISTSQVPKNRDSIYLEKVFIASANSSFRTVLGRPFYGEPKSVCSQTFLVIGYNPDLPLTKDECAGVISYIKTKFFRYLVSVKKRTQNGARGVYQFVPMQDFTKKWSDEELYKIYGLSESEIQQIESSISEME